MKAVILAGGSGTRLKPLTNTTSKQLLPIGNKPMIYYPVSLALMAGIKDILIISQDKFIPEYKKLFGNGDSLNINIQYKAQNEPEGLAHGLNLSKDFVDGEKFMFMLGDNIVHGHGLPKKITNAFEKEGHTMFSYWVEDPKSFGVIEGEETITNIVEKPENPKSNWASIGVYVFENKIFDYFDQIKPSARGEYELPVLVMASLNNGDIAYNEKLGRGYAWFDTGTMKSFNIAHNYLVSHEIATGKMIGNIEEIAYMQGFISKAELTDLVKDEKSDYFEYIKAGVLNE